MKRTPLLHAELSQVIAGMGHGDLLVIGDAGLPIPPGVRRIDLALTRDVPTVSQVLEAVLAELRVEQMLLARESLQRGGALPHWLQPHTPHMPAAPALMTHEEFKARSRHACAVVRTGEFTPYANIGLVSGVVF